MALYEKFGEFDSANEINVLAENLRAEGDKDSLFEVAKENGITEEFVKYFIDGQIDFLTDPLTAAIGKLDVEAAEIKAPEIMQDWIEFVKSSCLENTDLAYAVRRKGKSLKGAIAGLLKWGFANQYNLPKEVLKEVGVNGRVTLGVPSMTRAKKMLLEYYLGK